jgi:hypothetical protein
MNHEMRCHEMSCNEPRHTILYIIHIFVNHTIARTVKFQHTMMYINKGPLPKRCF